PASARRRATSRPPGAAAATSAAPGRAGGTSCTSAPNPTGTFDAVTATLPGAGRRGVHGARAGRRAPGAGSAYAPGPSAAAPTTSGRLADRAHRLDLVVTLPVVTRDHPRRLPGARDRRALRRVRERAGPRRTRPGLGAGSRGLRGRPGAAASAGAGADLPDLRDAVGFPAG